jgi:hypothetical protein
LSKGFLQRLFDGIGAKPKSIDPRIKNLNELGMVCKTCGESHKGLFHLGCDSPDQWPEPLDIRPNSDVLNSQHVVTSDMCILEGEHYFVRGVLELPIVNLPGEKFGYGAWSTLSKPNFDKVVEHFDIGCPPDLGPWFGWFSNRLKGYPDTLNLKCNVLPQPNRQRPLIELHEIDHPLVVEQRNGISIDRLFEIYRLNGHEFERC